MSLQIDAAFPFVTHGGIHEHQAFSPGLTKRELFSAMAMQGMLASTTGFGMDDAMIAHASVLLADALIAELAR